VIESNLFEFSKKMEKKAARFAIKADKHFRTMVRSISEEVITSTPVDTGRARSNWSLSSSTPTASERAPYSPGRKLGLYETANAQGAIRQVIATLAARARWIGNLHSVSVWLRNPVEYMYKLNERGTSQQAPKGFIQRAIERGKRKAAKANKGFRFFTS
jgi:hypothetical protein